MKQSLLKEIINLKKQKKEFAIITNLENGNSTIYHNDNELTGEFESYKDQIVNFYKSKNNGVIDGTNIFVESYVRPIKVVIVGAPTMTTFIGLSLIHISEPTRPY